MVTTATGIAWIQPSCLEKKKRRKKNGQSFDSGFHLLKTILYFPLLGFNRNLALLDISSSFSRGLKQMEAGFTGPTLISQPHGPSDELGATSAGPLAAPRHEVPLGR